MSTIKKTATKVGLSLFVGAGIAVLTAMAFGGLIDDLENKTYDFRYRMKYVREKKAESDSEEFPDYGIRIVDIDDRSMEKMGVYWNWDRSFQAQMIDSLSAHFPAAVAYDILFYVKEDPKQMWRLERILSRAVQSDSSHKNKTERLRDFLSSSINYDQQLENSIANSGRVYLGLVMGNEDDYDHVSQIAYRMNMDWHDSLKPSSTISLPENAAEKIKDRRTIIDGIYPDLARSAKEIGHVNVELNEDGIIRDIPLLYEFGNFTPYYLPLSVRTVMTLFGTPNEEVVVRPEEFIDIGTPFKIFKDSAGKITFSYPDISTAQIKAILAQKKKILSLKEGQEHTVSSYLALSRDVQGKTCLQFRGDAVYPQDLKGRIPYQLSKALVEMNMTDALKMEQGDEMALTQECLLIRDSDFEWLVEFPEGGEVWLTEQVLKTIGLVQHRDLAIEENQDRKLLFFAFSVKRNNGTLVSSIPVLRGKTLEELCRVGWEDIEAMGPGTRKEFGDNVRIPLRKHNRHIITYFGPSKKPFAHYSFYDVMQNDVRSEMEGKIFIVGSSSPSLFDIKPVPHEKNFPAVEIHASLMNSLLTNNFVKRLERWQDYLILVAVGVIIALVAFYLKPLWGGLIVAFSIFAYLVTAMVLFDRDLLWIEMVRPVLSIILSFTAVMAYRYMTEEKDRKFLQSTFKQYLSPELIDMMYTQKQKPKLGGEEGVRTAYFTDIQSFSTFSEKLGSPTKLVELLNEYLSAMTDILLSRYGTLDKYEGDAIIAFFGAPVSMPDHARQACLTALDMQSALGELRKKWLSEGDKWPEIVHNMRMRIGINTGAITTGNMGSAVRMNYTMMGDAVNLAARLESAAKQYGVYTMISHYTKNMIGDEFETRQLDKITVVGRSEPIVVFELLGRRGELESELSRLLDIHSSALEAFYSRKWQKAQQLFTKAHQLEPNRTVTPGGITPSKRLLELSRHYETNPPGPDWDGVNRLTSK
ncbi:MAG: CHASE2 domain-containing protein [Chitinispirillaceae bacterium]